MIQFCMTVICFPEYDVVWMDLSKYLILGMQEGDAGQNILQHGDKVMVTHQICNLIVVVVEENEGGQIGTGGFVEDEMVVVPHSDV